jgi:2-polyprenyl-3-methyl-5-hydroxy-6-metoxy-1,4-benzoquinol methylase
MDKQRQANLDLWQQYVDVNSKAESYHVEDFKRGMTSLNTPELAEVGDVKGKSLLHLQCHFGMDTLSWARMGAKVTGMDFSSKGIDLARSLAAELKLPANFVCCDLYDLPDHLQGQFDIVFTSYGVLVWLDDVTRWAQIVASYVKPGGIFYIAEFHPFAQVYDETAKGYQLRYPYFYKKPFCEVVDASYADFNTKIAPTKTYEWNHPLSEVVSALIQAGLQIEFLHEFPYSVYQQMAGLRETKDHTFVFREEEPWFPLMYSIRAKKPL